MREPPWCVALPVLRQQWLHTGIAGRAGKLFWRGQLKSNPAARGRGLQSSTFQLNASAFCGIGGAFKVVQGGV